MQGTHRRHYLEKGMLAGYERYLWERECCPATVEKYLRDAKRFLGFQPAGKAVTKQDVLSYKQELTARYAPASTNSMLTALNDFFRWLGWSECRVKLLKIQKNLFCNESRELTRGEYNRLVQAAKRRGNDRLDLLMQTICSTGIRISELRYITVEAAHTGTAQVCCKGKTRSVLLCRELQKRLLGYCGKTGITHGPIFVTKSGAPLERTNVWRDMKRLCASAGVDARKVFPHNLRHLFARTFYNLERDIVRLADILGHSSVETSRIYTMSSGREHERQLAALHLIL